MMRALKYGAYGFLSSFALSFLLFSAYGCFEIARSEPYEALLACAAENVVYATLVGLIVFAGASYQAYTDQT